MTRALHLAAAAILGTLALLFAVPAVVLAAVAFWLATSIPTPSSLAARLWAGLRRRAAAERPQCTGAGNSSATALLARPQATRTQAGRQADAQPCDQSLRESDAGGQGPSGAHNPAKSGSSPEPATTSQGPSVGGPASLSPAPARPAITLLVVRREHEC
jgi:hypothetical protein